MPRASLSTAALGLALMAIAIGIFSYLVGNRWEQRATFVRPDGHYQLVVMRQRHILSFAMPGQAGDASGEIIIMDQRGRVLHRQTVAMVQTVESVEWGTRKVSVKLQGEWPLPD